MKKIVGIFVMTLLILSAVIPVIVTANTNDDVQIIWSKPISSNIEKQVKSLSRNSYIVWNNDLNNYESAFNAQFSTTFDSFPADDFYFDTSGDIEVNDVHWIGYFVNGGPEGVDWCIQFFEDDGTGGAPNAKTYEDSYTGPFCFSSDEISKDDLGNGYYILSVDLPEIIKFASKETYWISIWAVCEFPTQTGWGYHTNQWNGHQAVFISDYFGYSDWTNIEEIVGSKADMCYQLTGPMPDLEGTGTISWSDVKPNEKLTASFTVFNVGGNGLDWMVSEYPEWGKEWTFNPDSGENLFPEDGEITVMVSVIAPNVGNSQFTGNIKVVNLGDEEDFIIIDVMLITPRNQAVQMPFFQFLLERFPNLFPILRQILG